MTITDAQIDQLARELAAATGESVPTAVATALRERLERIRVYSPGLADELNAIALRCAQLPLLEDRPEAEILGYND